MENRKTGLFFGSFNPVHHGHLMIASYMADFAGLAQVWFVVSPRSPFKQESELLADYHRRDLLEKAVGDYPRFRVSTVEFRLPKPSYTIDTLDFLAREHPGQAFCLILGSDQLDDFGRWKESARILENYQLLVYPRLRANGGTLTGEPALAGHPSVTMVEAPRLEISSTFIRNAIRDGKDVRFFMPMEAWKYLDEMNFYR